MRKIFFAFLSAFLMLILSAFVFGAEVELFSSPENSFYALEEFVIGAESELKIATYTFSHDDMAKWLIELSENGVSIKLMADKSPVGGLKNKDFLCYLAGNGIDVKLYDGPETYMHAKYIVLDLKKLMVGSENYGYGGFGGDNRGWGIITDDFLTVSKFSDVFDNDFEGSVELECETNEYELKESKVNEKKIDFEICSGGIEWLFAPDDALEKILSLMGEAEEKIYVEQLYVYKYWNEEGDSEFVNKLLEKARDGIEIKVMLDGSYFSVDKNSPKSNINTVEYLNEISKEDGLNLEAKLMDMKGLGISTLHNKGVIVDSEKVLISSVNWNENSPLRNREAGVIIDCGADYFEKLFLADWNGERIGTQGADINNDDDVLAPEGADIRDKSDIVGMFLANEYYLYGGILIFVVLGLIVARIGRKRY